MDYTVMKKSILFLLFAIVPIMLWADPVEINGIYYNLIEKAKIAEVTKNPNHYKGNVVIPESVNYNNVTYSVTNIGSNAFESSSELISISIPNSVSSIERYAFSRCSGLTSVTIPNSITSISYGVFDHCSSLTNITIPNSVTEIGGSAFRGSGLINVTIPNSVTKIGDGAFAECLGLTSITIPNSVTSIENATFLACTSLTGITIPKSVTKIGEGAFSGCTGLTSITIPNGVTEIGGSAFDYCIALTSITIPNSVTEIRSSAFSRCTGLTDVYCYADELPYAPSDAFDNSYIEYVNLHVPANSINKYKETEPWKNFGNIVALEGATTKKCETPTISYENGVLKMTCATEGVEYVTDIADADIKKHFASEITLSATYNISVYATKEGFDNSDLVTATLCWIDAEPKTEGITNGVANVSARAVLIQNNGGIITINGVEDGMRVSAYSLNGVEEAATISRNGAAVLNTNAQTGSTVIVKMGEKSVKVLMK